MHIELANNNGTKHLRLARCYCGTNGKGVKHDSKIRYDLTGIVRL